MTLLSDDQLDAVAGGYQNNGSGQHFEKPPNSGGAGGILGIVEQTASLAVAVVKEGLGLGLGSLII